MQVLSTICAVFLLVVIAWTLRVWWYLASGQYDLDQRLTNILK